MLPKFLVQIFTLSWLFRPMYNISLSILRQKTSTYFISLQHFIKKEIISSPVINKYETYVLEI